MWMIVHKRGRVGGRGRGGNSLKMPGVRFPGNTKGR